MSINKIKKITPSGEIKVRTKIQGIQEERALCVEAAAVAKEYGDLRENSEYQDMMDRIRQLDASLEQLDFYLKNVYVIKAPENLNVIDFGATVHIIRISDNREYNYTLVGDEESDIEHDLISENTPIAQSMIGKKAGEEFNVISRDGKSVSYKIISFRYLDSTFQIIR